MGPHKVAYCELYDHRDGTFTLNVKPQEAGRHTLQIKYGGEHVPGEGATAAGSYTGSQATPGGSEGQSCKIRQSVG